MIGGSSSGFESESLSLISRSRRATGRLLEAGKARRGTCSDQGAECAGVSVSVRVRDWQGWGCRENRTGRSRRSFFVAICPPTWIDFDVLSAS